MALMNIPIYRSGATMKTYVFPIELEEEEDGRWSATVPVCPAVPLGAIPKTKPSPASKEPSKPTSKSSSKRKGPYPSK